MGFNEYANESLTDNETKSYQNDAIYQCHSSRRKWPEGSLSQLFSLIFWTWINPIISIGYSRLLRDEDLYDLPEDKQCHILLNKLEKFDWKTLTPFKILTKIFWNKYLLLGLPLFPYAIARMSQPLLFRQIVLNIIDDNKNSFTMNIIYACLIGICGLIQVIIHQHYFFQSYLFGVSVRNALVTWIYQRLLSCKIDLFREMNSGQIFNLVANDVTKIEDLLVYGHFLWDAPVEVLITIIYFYLIIGLIPTTFVLLIFISSIVLQIIFSRYFRQYREKTIQFTDKRVHVLKQYLNAHHIVKMYNWEKAMEDSILRIREEEFGGIKKASYIRAMNIGMNFLSFSFVTLATISSLWFINHRLMFLDILTVLGFYCQIRAPISYYFPIALERLSEILVFKERINEYLQLILQKEKEKEKSAISLDKKLTENVQIIIENASFSWDHTRLCLSSLNLTIESNSFFGITGPVGSGKTSLLAAILGELYLVNGHIYVNSKSVSYAAQTPWIFAGTVRENILFGKSLDRERYEHVLKSCCLDVDLKLFGSSGDLTIIGENGVNLSGGQKARISLARALYVDVDIYLFDDPLGSLDKSVAKQIYERCFSPRSFLTNKTRLLVTHLTEYLTECDKTIVLDDGQTKSEEQSKSLFIRCQNENETAKDKETIMSNAFDEKSIIVNEKSEMDKANWCVWYSLFTALSSRPFDPFILIFLLVFAEIIFDISNYSIALWFQQNPITKSNDFSFVYIYYGLLIGTFIMGLSRVYYCFRVILNGSNLLHNQMINRLIYTSTTFLERNPTGRILNRVCNDQQVLDETFPTVFFDGVQSLLIAIGAIITICFINYWVLLVLIPLAPVAWLNLVYYIRTSRQMKQLESNSRSPIYSLFQSSMDDLITIRAFKRQTHMMKTFFNRLDEHTRVCVIRLAVGQWFAFRIEMLLLLLPFINTFISVLLSDRMDVTFVALSLMYSYSINGWFQWGIRQLAEAQNLMISAERIYEYTKLPLEEDDVEQERELLTSSSVLNNGNIEFRNYSLRYRPDLEPVLKNINLNIKSGEKIGIIGRTGSGKSSIFRGLLRLIHRQCVQGEILIDGVDIARIKLSQLRSHISIIPQKPILLGETLRYNLDPFNEYSDTRCLVALKDVQLKNIVDNHPLGLLQPVIESGNNFSGGQRQLICIARTLLKNSKILLLDEAVADVDQETEMLIRSVIHDKFQDKTVLIISHRHRTLEMSDRIMLMDEGKLMKFDTPDKILNLS